MKTHSFVGAIVLSFLILSNAFSQQWEWQSPLPQGNGLEDIQLFPNGRGIAVGMKNVFMRTTNSGETWSAEFLDIDSDVNNRWLVAASFVTDQNGWIIQSTLDSGGYGSGLFHTSDGGNTWSENLFPGQSGLCDVLFLNETTGFAIGLSEAGVDAGIARTTDAGSTWSVQQMDSAYGFSHLFFLDDETGWAVGASVAQTTDGGDTWTLLRRSHTNGFYEAQFFDELNGVGVGYHEFYRTHDGGATWESFPLGNDPSHFAMSLHFIDGNIGWIVGSDGWISATTDGGATWTNQVSGFNGLLYKVLFTDRNTGFISGDNGRILRTTDAGQHWTVQAGQRITDRWFYAVDFADTNYGWAVGGYYDGGRIIARTINGGNLWSVVTDNSDSSTITDVAAIDPNTAWFAGNASGLMKTTDGGQTFTTQTLPVNCWGGNFQFFNADSGWLTCGSRLLYTTNGGVNWQVVPTLCMYETHGTFFLDMQNGWSYGGKPATIEHTTDGGLTWNLQYVSDMLETVVVGVYFSDLQNGWAAEWGGSILHTSDGGDNWVALPLLYEYLDCTAMQWADASHGYVISDYEPMLYTTDGGVTWHSAPDEMSQRQMDCDFPDANHGWVVGWDGAIVKWNGNSLPVSPIPHIALPLRCSLSAYPNPFNPTTALAFSIPVTGRATLAVYDLNGRLVETLADEVLPAGEYHHVFDGTHLPSGIYFARLNGSNFSATLKLILLK